MAGASANPTGRVGRWSRRRPWRRGPRRGDPHCATRSLRRRVQGVSRSAAGCSRASIRGLALTGMARAGAEFYAWAPTATHWDRPRRCGAIRLRRGGGNSRLDPPYACGSGAFTLLRSTTVAPPGPRLAQARRVRRRGRTSRAAGRALPVLARRRPARSVHRPRCARLHGTPWRETGATRSNASQAAPPPTRSTRKQRERIPPLVPSRASRAQIEGGRDAAALHQRGIGHWSTRYRRGRLCPRGNQTLVSPRTDAARIPRRRWTPNRATPEQRAPSRRQAWTSGKLRASATIRSGVREARSQSCWRRNPGRSAMRSTGSGLPGPINEAVGRGPSFPRPRQDARCAHAGHAGAVREGRRGQSILTRSGMSGRGPTALRI